MLRVGIKNLEILAAHAGGDDFVKIPPQARDFEEFVLGAILSDEKAINLVAITLKSHHFYVDAHQRIYDAILSLFIEDKPIENITVVEELKRAGNLEAIGGSFYLFQLMRKVGSTANIEYHARIVIQKWTQRALIADSSITIREAYEDGCDPLELMAHQADRFMEIQQSITVAKRKNHKDEVNKLYDEMLIRRGLPEEQQEVLGLRTGIYKLDRAIYGLCPGELVILAGNASEGKTTAALQTLMFNAAQGIPVGLFSLEMTYKQLLQKMISMQSGVDLEKIITSKMDKDDWARVDRAFDVVMKMPIHIDDSPQDILDIAAISKLWKMKYDIELVAIDYLQLAKVPAINKRIQTREQEVAFITGQLKDLAKNLDIPVLALSQLSRKNDSRTDKLKRPILSDLRESGAIEQDANVVIFFFRPWKHGIEKYASGFSTKNITEIIVAKSRMGKLVMIYAKFIGAIGKFDNSHSEIKNAIAEGGDEAEEISSEPLNDGKSDKKINEDDLPF